MFREKRKYRFLLGFSFLLLMSTACRQKEGGEEALKGEALFERIPASSTGISFSNDLKPSAALNLFNYIYFYNGGGLAAGDFNNDGRIDLFFAANQGRNTLFLNRGNLHFEDVTDKTRIPYDSAWSTGLSVVDINNDGLLDIYVCRVGKYLSLNSHNLLLVCKGINKDGIPEYEDQAHAYGLDFSGFSTQAVFMDFDLDGDLDMFLLNHSVHSTGAFAPRATYMGTFHPLAGDRMFRNDNGKYTDITHEAAINSTAIGYGLGIGVGDINLDGYPDLYIGNDFPENDYLYINQRNGSFRDEINEHIMHTSQFSMGVDIADANNDGFPEILSLDMMPHDPEILKRSQLEEAYDVFQLKRNYGFNYQYTRNNLQFNRKNGMFTELGQYAGIFDTDWSWAPLWMDFDNDGKKDLFISNGIPKRMNDIDFIKYISNDEIRKKITGGNIAELESSLLNKFPQNKLYNKFFSNSGSLSFQDLEGHIKGNQPTYSNGAVYADLDNDGDLDIVVNNIDEEATVYRNLSNDRKENHYLDIKLKGPGKNINALGAKLILFAGNEIRITEKWPVHGFLSSMEIPVHLGMTNTRPDSLLIVWPDNSFEKVNTTIDTTLSVTYSPGLPQFNYEHFRMLKQPVSSSMKDITQEVKFEYRHIENPFIDFNWEPLIPHMLSTEGPALAVGDLNQDGLEDAYIGASKNHEGAIFIQSKNGRFIRQSAAAFQPDSSFEDVDACIIDVNNDRFLDLLVASGGNEYTTLKKFMQPRVYLNDGKAHFKNLENAFSDVNSNVSCIAPGDFNGDGYSDLFLGGRSVPWEYGQVPRSYLLQNDGHGKFSDVTNALAKDLGNLGMITHAIWFDLDKDGDPDLIVCEEWGGIYAFMNEKGHFSKKALTNKKGWWNFVLPADLDNDGDIDLIAGNLGLNTLFRASEKEPVSMYYYDFDGNGKKEQIITYYLDGRRIPFASIEELEKKIPSLRKRFNYAKDFAMASVEEIFSPGKLARADSFSASCFSNSILVNKGNLNFETRDLPWEAQLTSYRDGLVVDANGDLLPDLLLFGNFYDNNIQMGRNDGDFGTLLLNLGNGKFTVTPISGIVVKGQVRKVRKIMIGGKESYILARNDDSARVIRFEKSK